MIESAIRYIEDLFRNDFSGHDAAHTLRVFRLAERIAEAEGADLQTVRLAALLHDADDRKLSPETAKGKLRARAFLESKGLEEARIQEILKIIGEVSYSKLPRNLVNPPRTKWDVINLDTVSLAKIDTSAITQKNKVRRYRKGATLFNFHSWAPLSYDKGAFFELSVPLLRNVKYALQVKCASRVKRAFGTICRTLYFTLRQRRNTLLGRKPKLMSISSINTAKAGMK